MSKNMETKAEPDFSEFKVPSYQEWKETAEKALKGKPLEKLFSNTYENIELKPLYRKEDVKDCSHLKNNFPGYSPFIRGTEPVSYLIYPWKISQEIPASSPDEFNQKALRNIKRGQTALSLYPDKSNINNADDLDIALKNIPFENIDINIFAGIKSPEFCKELNEFLYKNKVDLISLRGGFDFCPLSTAAESGFLPFNLNTAMDKAYETASHASENCLGFKTIAVNTIPYHEGGANAVQETAYALSTSVFYMKNLIKRGMKPDEAASQIRFYAASGENFFMEIAKFRAVRRLWTKITSEFGCTEFSSKLNQYAVTTKRNKSKLDPYVNLLRNTTEALAAVLGGCSTLQILFFDDGIRNIGEFSERIARNSQIILQEECNLQETADPAGGSWYVEYLTQEISLRAWTLFRKIESIGGMAEALKNDYIQDDIEKVRQRRENNLSSGKDVLTGANLFPNLDEKDISENLIIANKTIKMIHSAKQNNNIFKIKPVEKFRSSEMFEKLREKADEYKKKHGRLPGALLLNFGQLNEFKVRADFSADFLAAGGIKSVRSEPALSYEKLAETAIISPHNVLVFCSSDDNYPDFVPQAARLIKRAKPLKTIILAGYPKDHIEEFKNAGVDIFIHFRADIVKIISELHQTIL